MTIAMPHRVRVLAMAMVLAAGLLAAVLAKPAWADTALCEGTLPPGTYNNVIVPQGTFCDLSDSIVLGNVTALEQSRLVMFRDEVHGNVRALESAEIQLFDTEVRGNIKGENANAVQISRGIVGGNILIVGANVPGPFGPIGAIVDGTLLPEGNIQIAKNTTPGVGIVRSVLEKGNVQVAGNVVNSPSFAQGIQIRDNQVAGNMQVFNNSGPTVKAVQFNTVGATLQCFGNIEPFIGGPNFAQKAVGQCF